MTVIGLSGLKGSGKDTAADLLVAEYGFTKIAFADGVREMALAIDPMVVVSDEWVRLSSAVQEYGWDWVKRSSREVRGFLQRLGTEAVRNILDEDVWIKLLKKKYPDIGNDATRYVISDCRFANEASFIHSCHGDIVWITRPGVKSDGHSSEDESLKRYADYVVNNDETVEELWEDMRLLLFMKGIDPVDREQFRTSEAIPGE